MTTPPEGPVHVPPAGLTESHAEPHGAGDHGETHGHDDHGHDEPELGPIDVPAWGAGLIGLAVGLVVVYCFVLATGRIAL